MTTPNLIAIAGIVYDIAGAMLLVQAIVRTRDEILVRQSQHRRFSGGNLELFKALDWQRHDACFGLGLLVAGFILQLFAAIGFALPVSWLGGSLLTVVLVAAFAWWRISAKRLAATAGARFAASLDGIDRLNFLRLHPEAMPPGEAGRTIAGWMKGDPPSSSSGER